MFLIQFLYLYTLLKIYLNKLFTYLVKLLPSYIFINLDISFRVNNGFVKIDKILYGDNVVIYDITNKGKLILYFIWFNNDDDSGFLINNFLKYFNEYKILYLEYSLTQNNKTNKLSKTIISFSNTYIYLLDNSDTKNVLFNEILF